MIKRQITSFTIRVFIALTQFGCNSDGPSAGCEANNGIVWEYVAPEDVMVRVYENGEAYFVENGGCTFAAQFFTPGFFEQNYVRTPTSISAKLDDGTLLPLFESFVEDFEGHENALDMIILDPEDRTRFYSSFTLQSPSAKTVSEYVDLRQCIRAIIRRCGNRQTAILPFLCNSQLQRKGLSRQEEEDRHATT